jgi:hypothetical protein
LNQQSWKKNKSCSVRVLRVEYSIQKKSTVNDFTVSTQLWLTQGNTRGRTDPPILTVLYTVCVTVCMHTVCTVYCMITRDGREIPLSANSLTGLKGPNLTGCSKCPLSYHWQKTR